jgi:hypothetical protein
MLPVGQHRTQFSHSNQCHPKENALGASDYLLDQRHPFFIHLAQLTQRPLQLPKNEPFYVISCVLVQYQVTTHSFTFPKCPVERVPRSTRSTDLGVPALSQTDQCVDNFVASFIFVKSIDEEAETNRSASRLQITGHQLV